MSNSLHYVLYILGGMAIMIGLILSGDTYGTMGALYAPTMISSGITCLIAGAFVSIIIHLPESIVEQFKIEKTKEKLLQEGKEKREQEQ